MYAIGGYDGSVFLRTVECFDAKTGVWSECAPMAVKRLATYSVTLSLSFSGFQYCHCHFLSLSFSGFQYCHCHFFLSVSLCVI